VKKTFFSICALGLALSTLLAGCGMGSGQAVNVLAVYDDSTLSCDMAEDMAAAVGHRSSLYQIAQSKLSYCEVVGGGGMFLPVGYFEATKKHYVFRRLELDDPQAVRRLCLDLALEAGLDSIPPADLRFVTEWGEFECASLAGELAQLGVSVMVAPAHLPLFIDVDPVLVFASGANAQREGVPKRYYDEVRDMLIKNIQDFDSRH